MNPDLDKHVRPAAWAGAFYPAEPAELRRQVTRMLMEAEEAPVAGHLIGLIVPHAGYIYSGPTAARAYRLLKHRPIKTVMVIAPSHAEWFEGVSVYGGDFYETPLGRVRVDRAKSEALAAFDRSITLSEAGHHAAGERSEHSLEVQLPFLQIALDAPFQLVAVVFHDYRPDLCRLLGLALAGVMEESDLLVASTDLYHGYSYKACKRSDDATLQALSTIDPEGFCSAMQAETVQACGAGPLAALLYASREKKANTITLLYRTNSADVTGSREGWTVGYASLSISRCLKE